MTVLAHRGNLEGPDMVRENSFEKVADALSLGFGIETDLRFTAAGLPYISHDPVDPVPGQLADAHFHLWARYPERMVALNIKETWSEACVLELLGRYDRIDGTVLFDMELIEENPGEMAKTFLRLEPGCKLAARVSDRGESIERALSLPGEYIWLDEMDGEWAQPDDIARLGDAGRRVLAVSRDLHGVRPERCIDRWIKFASWGVDAICTDWSKLLVQELGLEVG